MPLEWHVPDKPLSTYAAREFDTFVYLCYRENIEFFDGFDILKIRRSDRLLLSKRTGQMRQNAGKPLILTY